MNQRTFVTREVHLREVVAHVETCAEGLALPRSLVLRLCLVVEELFINTARHGGETEARVALVAEERAIWLHYSDGAPPFNPLEALAREALARTLEQRPVGGLGRILVDELSAAAHYERAGDCNVLRLRFELD